MRKSDEPKWAEGLSKPPAWRSDGTETVFDTPWMALTRHPATAPTGMKADYAVVRFKNVGTGVLPVHDDGTVTLVGQQRFAHANYSWEMPEGGAPLDEDPFDGIRRELAEEADLCAHTWHVLCDQASSPGMTSEFLRIFLARDLEAAEHSFVREDEEAGIVPGWVDLDEALAAVLEGRVRNATAQLAILHAWHARARGWSDLVDGDAPWDALEHVRQGGHARAAEASPGAVDHGAPGGTREQ